MMIVNPDLPTEKVLKFYYDAEGRPLCLDFNGTVYLYITNLQGDVVALADQYGEVIRYEYDAWGKPISTYYVESPYYDAMQYNPLRYRGYIYDNETGFYYLQSRYYDPVVGRFINADSYASTGTGPLGYNMFTYCKNNPVMNKDSAGDFPVTAFIVTVVVSVVASVIVTAATDYWENGKVNGWKVASSGVINGTAAALTFVAPAAAIPISMVASGLETAIHGWIDGDSPQEVVVDTTFSVALGAVTGSWGGGATSNIYDEAIEAFPKLCSGAKKVVKDKAKKTIKKAAKELLGEQVDSLTECFAISGVHTLSTFYANSYISTFRAHLQEEEG